MNGVDRSGKPAGKPAVAKKRGRLADADFKECRAVAIRVLRSQGATMEVIALGYGVSVRHCRNYANWPLPAGFGRSDDDFDDE